MNAMKKLGLVISYVTSVRILDTSCYEEDEDAFRGLAKYLPTVGLLIGAVLLCEERLLAVLQVNILLSAALLTMTWLWLTGGLHMDGLMDTADGIFSHRSKERILEIMRDSRAGNFAILVAITALTLKVLGLAVFQGSDLSVILFLVPALARACEVYAIGRFNYARREGKGKIWHESTVFPLHFAISLLPVLLAAAFASRFVSFKLVSVLFLATVLGGMIVAHWLDLKVGGHTGDTYGAVVEASEVIGIVTAAIFGLG
jgi:adenosylcobinamide-GDP ribazoletransferase